MLAVTFAPVPVACTSRMRPSMSVSAPGKGATPEGKLCVSADSRMGDMNFCCTHLEGMLGLEGGYTLSTTILHYYFWKKRGSFLGLWECHGYL